MEIILIFAGAILVAIIVFLIIWFRLAPNNRWFTFVKEGTAKIIVRGDKFEKCLIQWNGRTFDYRNPEDLEKWNVIKEEAKKKEPWHPFGGLRYYGFYPIKDAYIYNFEWTGVSMNGETQHHPKETLDYVLLKDNVYYAKVEKAEDKELLPLDVELVLTIRVINPYKALFEVQNWLEMIINKIKPAVRDAVSLKEYELLISDTDAVGKKIYKRLKERKLLEEFKDRYGVELGKIGVKDINPPKEYREETLKKWSAEREKERIAIEAKAEKQRLKTVAEGEALRIGKVFKKIEKFGELGRLLKSLEAMEKSPLAASMTVQAVPGLQELLKAVFGKTDNSITSKELRKLREMLSRLPKEK